MNINKIVREIIGGEKEISFFLEKEDREYGNIEVHTINKKGIRYSDAEVDDL